MFSLVHFFSVKDTCLLARKILRYFTGSFPVNHYTCTHDDVYQQIKVCQLKMRQIINMISGTKYSRKSALYIKILKQWYQLKTQTRTCNWVQKILKQWYQLKTQTRTCYWVQVNIPEVEIHNHCFYDYPQRSDWNIEKQSWKFM